MTKGRWRRPPRQPVTMFMAGAFIVAIALACGGLLPVPDVLEQYCTPDVGMWLMAGIALLMMVEF